MTEPTANTLTVPDGTLYYEVRGAGPLVALVGAPMDAGAFAPLADLLATDHTVLTLDPRGVHRSTMVDVDADSTPEQRAEDLARLIEAVDAGPATVVGSRGGAVTVLALLQTRPELVRTVVAHEPPLEELLDDRDQRRAQQDAVVDAYLTEGSFAAWTRFLADADIDGVEPSDVTAAVGGADAGETAEPGTDGQAAADERHFFLHEMLPTTRWHPDLEVLRSSPRRVVIGIGADSTGQTCDLTSRALADELGIVPTVFPGGHVGFVEDAGVFAAHLRRVVPDQQLPAGMPVE